MALRYRLRPPEIQAVQWTGDNADEMAVFAGQAFIPPANGDPAFIYQGATRSEAELAPGDWVTSSLDGWFTRTRDEVFVQAYELAPGQDVNPG